MDEKIKSTETPSVMALAYLGDARHSLYVRHMLVARGLSKSAHLNSEAQKYVTAEAQAKMYEKIEPCLSDEELAVFKRAMNSKHLNKPRHASGKEYRTATGFEAVIGFLEWHGNEERLKLLLDKSHREDIENDTEN